MIINTYWGQYTRTDKFIKAPNIAVVRPYITSDIISQTENSVDKITLIFEDDIEGFWPAIAQLEDDEAVKLAEILLKAVKHKDNNEQFVEKV